MTDIERAFLARELSDMGGHVDQATLSASQAHAIARKTESLIRSRVAERSQKTVAFSMGEDASAVNRWLSGQTGIPLQSVGAFLNALDLRVIPNDELSALRKFASRHLMDASE